MSDEIQVEGKSYISSKRASTTSGYAQDYIGQLARKSLIDARRIGGLWYISMESLQNYQQKAAEFKPVPPARPEGTEPGTLIFFDGKEYLSAAKAAEVTGYTQDYVGQLARAGTILSQQVGNRWYVERQSILSHKKEKDALLAAVQSQSVGISKPIVAPKKQAEYQAEYRYSGQDELLNYFGETGDLMPVTASLPEHENSLDSTLTAKVTEQASSTAPLSEVAQEQVVAIRRIPAVPVQTRRIAPRSFTAARAIKTKRSVSPMLLLAAAATIVIVVSAGYASTLKQNSVYAVGIPKIPALSAMPASVASAFEDIGNILEPLLTHDLTYVRSGTQ